MQHRKLRRKLLPVSAGTEGDAVDGGESTASTDNDAIDADFEVVDEDDKDK